MSLGNSETKSWTDDLPVCANTGVGLSTNQVYRQDGYRKDGHEFEDRSFHFKINDSIYLYGVFNGTDGSHVADFAAQRLPAEILLGQLSDKTTPAGVKEVLRDAFLGVEKSYFESVDDLLAIRTNLQCELPDGISSYNAYQKYPDIVNRLRSANARLHASSSAAIALIFNGNLYVANVGNCRALMCKIDADGVLRVVQLTVDHDLTNEDELLRLSHSGLDVDKLCKDASNGSSHFLTRCLGNYNVKGGYKDFDMISTAKTEPVIAEADITGPIALDGSCRFLLLMTQGLYGALEEATKTEQPNKEIAQIVVEQFSSQATLVGVAQGVVDRVARIHHDRYMQDPSHTTCRQREDITLLIRNFNFQPCTSLSTTSTLRSMYDSMMMRPRQEYSTKSSSTNDTLTEPSVGSSSDSSDTAKPCQPRSMDVGEDGRIAPYVDFSSFYEAVSKAQQDGLIQQDEIYQPA